MSRRGGLEDRERQAPKQLRQVFGGERRRPNDPAVRLRRGGLVGRSGCLVKCGRGCPDIGDRHGRQGGGQRSRTGQELAIVIRRRQRQPFSQRQRADRRAVDAGHNNLRQQPALRGRAKPLVRGRQKGAASAGLVFTRGKDQIRRTDRRQGSVG